MRKSLFATLLLTCSTAALAEDWVLVSTSDNDTDEHYVDRSSVRDYGSYKRAWTMTKYIDGWGYDGSYKSSRLFEIDCNNERTRILSLTRYYKDGDIDSIDPSSPKWIYVRPESVMKATFSFVCFGS